MKMPQWPSNDSKEKSPTAESEVRALFTDLDSMYGADAVNTTLDRMYGVAPATADLPPASNDYFKFVEPLKAKYGGPAITEATTKIRQERTKQ